MAVLVVRVGSDHGIVTDGVADGEWGGVEKLSGKFDIGGGGVGGDEGSSGENVWFGNFVEQLAGVEDVGGLAVNVDEAIEDEIGWGETGGEDVCMDGTCDGLGC